MCVIILQVDIGQVFIAYQAIICFRNNVINCLQGVAGPIQFRVGLVRERFTIFTP